MRRTIIVSLISGALLGGVVLSRLGLAASWAPVTAAAVLLVVGRSRMLLLAAMLVAVALGMWRAEAYAVGQQELAGLIGQKVSLTGVVNDDPGYDPRGFMSFKLGDLRLDDGRPLPGELSVYMYQTNLHRGYRVAAVGKVKPGFGNAVAELSYPQLTIASQQQDWLEHLRQRFFVGTKTALAEPMASFGLGLLVGVRALIPKPLQAELSLVGLSHLVAVSGYNLTIIVAAAHKLLQRFGRGPALAASLWLIGGFLVVTGASASIVRASLVAVLALIATHYGRRFDPLALILVAAAVTAAFKPAFLTDLGWLLSFLAFFGIMVLAPAVEARLGHPKNVFIKLFIESTTAQILTVPIILYYFGQLSIVAPLSNLLLLPLVPLAMLLSFVAGIAGMLVPAFAGWLAWPAYILLGGMLQLVDWLAKLPWAGRNEGVGLVGMLVMYGLLLALTIGLKVANSRAGRPNQERTGLEPSLTLGGAKRGLSVATND